MRPKDVILNKTASSLYAVPLMLEHEGLADVVCEHLGIENRAPELTEWKEMVHRQENAQRDVKIALVGKYTALPDAYISVMEALKHAGFEQGATVHIEMVNSEDINENSVHKLLSGSQGIIVPGGFGGRGIDGMILAVKYARENNIPFFGICLGMQISVIEYARNVLGFTDANSGEFDENTPHKVIDFMEGQNNEINKGGTLRLGSYPCVIAKGTTMERCYKKNEISERHRHRYEFNNSFRDALTAKGLVLSGTSPDNALVETVELTDRDFYVGVQYHPEFKSRPNKPHPLFMGFISAALKHI